MAALRTATQRLLLLTFLLCIGACALVGIWAVLFSNWNDFIVRVLATTGAVGVASLGALGAAIPWHLKRWHPIGPLGVFTMALALASLLVFIWIDTNRFEDYLCIRLVVVAWTLALSTCGAAVLSLARLRRGFEWVRKLTVLSAFLLTALVAVVLLLEVRSSDDLLPRIMATLGIVVTCGCIAVPVLHRISAIPAQERVQTSASQIALTCPRCARAQTLPVGRSKCGQCGLKFVLQIEEERCPKCGYSLYNLQSAHCPECGAAVLPAPQPAAG